MADANNQELRVEPGPGKMYALSGKIMLSAFVILFAVVVFMVGLHLYARWYLVRLRRRQLERRRVQRRASRSQIVMYIDSRLHGGCAAEDRGLDRTVLSSLPVFLYSPKAEERLPPPECAVCLSEFEEKEIARLLPKCSHSFHIECIDMWFRYHSTCPLCRSPVEQVFPWTEPVEKPLEPAEKANVTEPGSSSGSGPGGVDCSMTSLEGRRKGLGPTGMPPRRVELESELTQNSPAGRFLPLRRLLSMGRGLSAATPTGTGTRCGEASEVDLETGLSESTRCPSQVQTPI